MLIPDIEAELSALSSETRRLLSPPPDSWSPLSLLLSGALVKSGGVRPCPSLPKALESFLEASKGVRGWNRGDVLGRSLPGYIGGLVLDPGIIRSTTRRILEGIPS